MMRCELTDLSEATWKWISVEKVMLKTANSPQPHTWINVGVVYGIGFLEITDRKILFELPRNLHNCDFYDFYYVSMIFSNVDYVTRLNPGQGCSFRTFVYGWVKNMFELVFCAIHVIKYHNHQILVSQGWTVVVTSEVLSHSNVFFNGPKNLDSCFFFGRSPL